MAGSTVTLPCTGLWDAWLCIATTYSCLPPTSAHLFSFSGSLLPAPACLLPSSLLVSHLQSPPLPSGLSPLLSRITPLVCYSAFSPPFFLFLASCSSFQACYPQLSWPTEYSNAGRRPKAVAAGIMPKYCLLVQAFPEDSGELPFLLCCTSFLAQTWPSMSPLLFNQKSLHLTLCSLSSLHTYNFPIFPNILLLSSPFFFIPLLPCGPVFPSTRCQALEGRKANHKQSFAEHLLRSRCCTRHIANKADKTLILGEAYFAVEGDR